MSRHALSLVLAASAVSFVEFRGIAGSFSAMALDMALDIEAHREAFGGLVC